MEIISTGNINSRHSFVSFDGIYAVIVKSSGRIVISSSDRLYVQNQFNSFYSF